MLESKRTVHGVPVTADEPGCTMPKSVTSGVFGAHPATSRLVALGTVAVMTVVAEAPMPEPGSAGSQPSSWLLPRRQ